jgi:hypothetical protein
MRTFSLLTQAAGKQDHRPLHELKRQDSELILMMTNYSTVFVVKWSEFLARDPEVPGSIPGATRFSEK